ncbi:MAG: helix-turn-helix domain-containing protein [Candidatus Acidiferrales bacterium]
MSRGKIQSLSVGQLVRSVREAKGLSKTEMAYHLGVSEAAIRQYEAGARKAKAPFIKLLAEAAPPEVRGEIEGLLPEHLRGRMSIRIRGRRYSEETVMEAHDALDLVLDHAPSEVVKKLQEFLEKHGMRWRKET